MWNKIPDMEYFFYDTGTDLPETYKYLAKLEDVLVKPIKCLNSKREFSYYFEIFRDTPPSLQIRRCVSILKIKLLEDGIGKDDVVLYVAIRANDSNYKRHVFTKPNIA